MAQFFLSINRGQTENPYNVVAATATPTADFFLQILTTNNPTTLDTIMALRAIEQYLLSRGIPADEGIDIPPL
jgi:hypothetical protein